MPTIDDEDREILSRRVAKLDQREGPRVGDFVQFETSPEPVARRIAYLWDDSFQTTDGGSFYLDAAGFCAYSGALYLSVPLDTLTPTDETCEGSVWFFHHDWHAAHNGVHTEVLFRVFRCSAEAPAV